RHLTGHDSCAIHDRLEREGFRGCAAYDCRGAGQIVTALFAGLSWNNSPTTARQMFAAFAKMREIQIMRSIVRGTPALALRLDPPGGWTLEALLILDLGSLRHDLRTLLAADTGGAGTNAPILHSRVGGWADDLGVNDCARVQRMWGGHDGQVRAAIGGTPHRPQGER
ncbi:MAG: hypothetical protein ABIY37_15255, partial [Devosia sp.]